MLFERCLSWLNRSKAVTYRTPKIRRKPRSILLSQDWLLEDRCVLSSSILGNELLVNTSLVGKQAFDVSNDRSMDITSDGTAIVAWTDQTKGIVARRIGEDGLPIGTEFLVGGATDTLRGNANVAVYRKAAQNEQDRVVITWTSTGNGGDKSGAGVFARVFAVDGTPLSTAFRVNVSTTGDQKDSAVEWLSANRFVVTWSGAGQGEARSVFARLFDATGAAVSTEIRVPETRLGAQENPAVISLPNGGFQVAWSGNGPGDHSGIYSRQFTSAGVKIGTIEFRVNDASPTTDSQPTMARSADQVIIAWQTTDNGSPNGSGVLARRFTLDRKPQGAVFIVNETIIGNQTDPSIAAMNDGGFVVAWRSAQNGDGIYQREFNSDGTPRFGERLVNSTLDGTQTNPTVRSQGPDGYVVVWDGKIGADAQGIGMQRYGDPLMPTITSDNKKIGDYYETLYLDPSVPMKTFTLHNSSNMTIYPMLEDANSAAAPSDNTISLYDPYDPLNQEYRGYIGYKDPKTGKFYLGLRPGETYTFQVPLAFWDAGRMHITTDAHYLITPTGIGNPQPNPFKYYDIDPFAGNPQTFDGSVQVTNQLPTDTLVLTGDQTAKLTIGLSVYSDGNDLPTGTTVVSFEAGQGDTTIVHLSAAATFGGTPHKYTFYKPTARFMEDTSIDGSLGRVMWYHARAKTSGFAEQVGLDAPTQLTEFTIRDPFMGDASFKTSNDIATSEKISLINYDVSYVDSMVLPVAMETTDAQLYPLQQYKGTISPGSDTLVLKLHYDPKLLVKDLLVTSDNGDIPHDTKILSVEAGANDTTIVHLTKTGNPNAGTERTYSFTHPTPTAAFGWIGSAKTMAEMQAAIKQFTLGNKPNQNINGLGLYFADENNPDGNGYPQFYNPDLTLSGIKLPSGQNLPGQSPLKADPGVLGPTSNYDSNRFIITSGGTAPIQLTASGSAGGSEGTGPNELYLNFPLTMTHAQREDFRQQLVAGIKQWVVVADQKTLPSIKSVGAFDNSDRFKVILNGPTNLASGGYSLVFKRPITDYASTKLANIWYSWAKHYVDSVTKSHPNFVPLVYHGTISTVDENNVAKPTNLLSIQGDVTKSGLLSLGMVVETDGNNFPLPTATDPITRVTILDMKYDSASNTTVVSLSKRPTGVGSSNVNYTFKLPVMLTPNDPGVTTFEMSFTKDAAEAEKFGQSVYQLMEAMSTIKLLEHQGPDWLQLLTNCIGGNIGFIQDIGISVDPRKGYEYTGYAGIANTIRTRIKSVLRGVSDFNAVPENSGKWYPDPSLKGDKTGQLINGKSATFNVLNIDPFVWFVHKQLGLSGYGFSLDDDVADVGANGATKLSVDVGGIKSLPQKAEWTWGATFGPVDSKQGKIETYQSGDANNGLKKITMLDTSPLPVGLQVHGGDPDVGPGALVYGPGIPLGTRVLLPIPFDNQVILDTKVPPDTAGLVGPFNFRGAIPPVSASAVSGKSATLQVLDTLGLYGETTWTYTWSMVDGPNGANATFASNKTNAAKQTKVAFSASGSYLIRVKITAKDGSFMTSDITIKV